MKKAVYLDRHHAVNHTNCGQSWHTVTYNWRGEECTIYSEGTKHHAAWPVTSYLQPRYGRYRLATATESKERKTLKASKCTGIPWNMRTPDKCCNWPVWRVLHLLSVCDAETGVEVARPRGTHNTTNAIQHSDARHTKHQLCQQTSSVTFKCFFLILWNKQ